MVPEIKFLSEKKLAGIKLEMSFSEDRTFQLWQKFMPRRKEIFNHVTSDLISMQVFPESFDFVNFNPATRFEKWAAVEIIDFQNIPDEMETFTLPSGLYAVFFHRGAASEGERTFRYIFGTWLPASGYLLDNRPHFEILGSKYKNNDPESEEEVWIPVRAK